MSVLRQFVDVLRSIPRDIEREIIAFADRATGEDEARGRRELMELLALDVEHEQSVLDVCAVSGRDQYDAAQAVAMTVLAERDPQELVDLLRSESVDPLKVAHGWLQDSMISEEET